MDDVIIIYPNKQNRIVLKKVLFFNIEDKKIRKHFGSWWIDMAVTVVLNAINVNGQYTQGLVAVGENAQVGWSSHGHNNFNSGPLMGMSIIFNPFNFMFDPDIFENPISDNDNFPTWENQQL